MYVEVVYGNMCVYGTDVICINACEAYRVTDIVYCIFVVVICIRVFGLTNMYCINRCCENI